MIIAPGVYKLALPLYSPPVVFDEKAMSNSYLLRGDDGCMLIDSCWDTELSRDALEAKLAGLGLGLKDIKKVIYTHTHPDHFGQAGLFEKFGVTWQAAHRIEIDYIQNRFSYAEQEILDIESRWCLKNGVPSECIHDLTESLLRQQHMVRFFKPTVSLESGDVIEFAPFKLRVIWTPGHAPGHICLYEPRLKILFCGDNLTGRLPPHIPFYSVYNDDTNPVGLYLSSLKLLEPLEVDQVLPAHGKQFGSYKTRLDQIRQTVEQRKESAFKVFDGQMLNAFQVMTALDPGLEWGKLITVLKRSHIVETVARLQALRIEGRLESVLRDGLVLYRRTGQRANL